MLGILTWHVTYAVGISVREAAESSISRFGGHLSNR